MPKGVLSGLGMHDRLKIHDFRSSMSTMSPHVPDNIKGRERESEGFNDIKGKKNLNDTST